MPKIVDISDGEKGRLVSVENLRNLLRYVEDTPVIESVEFRPSRIMYLSKEGNVVNEEVFQY